MSATDASASGSNGPTRADEGLHEAASRPLTPRTRLGLVLAFLASEAVVLALLLGPIASQDWTSGFRRYFANDQLSYAAIASNVAQGNVALVEPFTLTGSLYYPSGWYQLMGLVGLVTGLSVPLLWTLLGLLVVSAAVAMVGWTAWRLSGRAWAPLLPGLALLTGTLATVRAGDWLQVLGHHAVLWGPYGSLFTLNAEVAGVSLATIALCLLLLAASGSLDPKDPEAAARGRAAAVVGTAAILGLLANVQTYSFLAGSFLAALYLAVVSLLRFPSRARAIVTVALLALVLVAGTAVADIIGPLPLFGLLLLALAPAVWPLARRHAALTLWSLLALAATASPQVGRTLLGVATGDPFLTYRQASSEDLGVPLGPALVAALPLLLVGAFCALAVWRRRRPDLAALLIALLVGVLVLASNDRWGFNQEPYRFWLQFAILASMLLMPVLAWSLTHLRGLSPGRRAATALAGVAAVAAWAVSLPDVVGFWTYARDQGVIATEDPRSDAVRALLTDRDGMVMSSSCLDPRELKLVWPGPVAFYNAGLAWPASEQDFKIFQDVERRAGQDPIALQAAGVTYVLTDSGCSTEWQFPGDQRVLPIATEPYVTDAGTAELTLWLVQPS